MSGIDVRRIRADDAATLRDIRLRALATDPGAFAGTLAEDSAKPETWWEEWAAEDARGEDAVTFLALAEEQAVGIVAGFESDDDASEAVLIAMWVDPEHRGSGIGYRLVREVQAWARARGLRWLRLSVAEEQTPARELYRKCGFEETGGTKRLRSNPAIRELEMAWRVRS